MELRTAAALPEIGLDHACARLLPAGEQLSVRVDAGLVAPVRAWQPFAAHQSHAKHAGHGEEVEALGAAEHEAPLVARRLRRARARRGHDGVARCGAPLSLICPADRLICTPAIGFDIPADLVGLGSDVLAPFDRTGCDWAPGWILQVLKRHQPEHLSQLLSSTPEGWLKMVSAMPAAATRVPQQQSELAVAVRDLEARGSKPQ